MHEVVLGEASWYAIRGGLYSCAPLLVAFCFGLPPSPRMFVVPVVTIVTAAGFALWDIRADRALDLAASLSGAGVCRLVARATGPAPGAAVVPAVR